VPENAIRVSTNDKDAEMEGNCSGRKAGLGCRAGWPLKQPGVAGNSSAVRARNCNLTTSSNRAETLKYMQRTTATLRRAKTVLGVRGLLSRNYVDLLP
jgi:hypothetical protein